MSDFDVLQNYTDEQLEDELKRRQTTPPDPLPSEDVKIYRLFTLASEYLESIAKVGRPPKDSEHFMFEEVMKTFYGGAIFKWINKHNKGE